MFVTRQGIRKQRKCTYVCTYRESITINGMVLIMFRTNQNWSLQAFIYPVGNKPVYFSG